MAQNRAWDRLQEQQQLFELAKWVQSEVIVILTP
jgi:hypothetical protein